MDCWCVTKCNGAGSGLSLFVTVLRADERSLLFQDNESIKASYLYDEV